MIILSHRGLWTKEEEKNTLNAFKLSFSKGFGAEIDVRDFQGELVVSHDIADEKSPFFADVMECYRISGGDMPIAINIKADGLQRKIKEILKGSRAADYFVFDMSAPDGILFINMGMNVFTRQSEYEREPFLYDESCGIWLDEFKDHWITEDIIRGHISNKKKICIVSPELHGRDFVREWEHYKEIEKRTGYDGIMICTDHPEKAGRFFNG